MVNRCENLDAALKYRRNFKWSTVPLIPKKKKPFIKYKELKTRLPSESEIRSHYARWPNAGVAVITGKISGVEAYDIDLRNHTINADPRLANELLEICAEAPLIETPNGYHLLVAHGGNGTGKKRVPPGVDHQTNGKLLVLPPSQHRDGGYYRWLREPQKSLAPISKEAIDLLESYSIFKQPDKQPEICVLPLPPAQ